MKKLEYIPQRTNPMHPISKVRRREEAVLMERIFWQNLSGSLTVVIIIATIFICAV